MLPPGIKGIEDVGAAKNVLTLLASEAKDSWTELMIPGSESIVP